MTEPQSIVPERNALSPADNERKKLRWWIVLQFKQMRDQGASAIFRKIRKSVVTIVSIPPALIILVLMRLLKPLVLIRVGPLISQRIGHFAANTELYLCERNAGMHERGPDIFYLNGPVSNYQLKKMLARTIHLAPAFVSPIVLVADKLNRLLPGGEAHSISVQNNGDRDTRGLFNQTKPFLAFTSREEARGRDALHKLGVPDDAAFVAFHARSPAYLAQMHRYGDFQYHDFRDCDIHNFVPAAEELVGRGYYALRMGAIVEEALTTDNPRIIDYAADGSRTDFLDIYVPSKCRFFVGNTAGIYAVASVFRRPIAFTNFIPLEYAHTWGRYDLFIPKLLWLQEERRLLTFKEILDGGIGRFLEGEKYARAGIEPIENTPEEITGLVVEMDERLNGTWRTTKEDEELQRRFWSLFRQSELHGEIITRIGADFLRRHRDLLD